jgi:thioredoxin 1
LAPVVITKSNYDQEVLNSKLPVLIDFWAPWCGPCRMVSPIVNELSQELDGKIKTGKINIDEEPELAENFKVMSIPTLAVVKDGKVTATLVGVRTKDAIKKALGI